MEKPKFKVREDVVNNGSTRRSSKIHYNDKGRYICNRKVTPAKDRMTKDFSLVTCTNCFRHVGMMPKVLVGESIGEINESGYTVRIIESCGEVNVVLPISQFVRILESKGVN